MRIQYLAYRELKAAVETHRARSGSVVILDVKSGDILAMANQPSYNPNNRSTIDVSHLRNRAITDVFEPGSTMKLATIAAALESKKYNFKSRAMSTKFIIPKSIISKINDGQELSSAIKNTFNLIKISIL